MPRYIQKLGARFYYVRRLPKDIAEIEGRSDIKISLRTDSRAEAEAQISNINERIELRWQAIRDGRGDDAEKHWKSALDLARSFGFAYREKDQLLGGDLGDIVARLEALETVAVKPDRRNASALLGTARKPALTLEGALDRYWGLTRERTADKSPNQIRKWKNPRIKAVRNFVQLMGNMELTAIDRDAALNFRDWWADRVLNDGLQAESANKDLGHLSHIVTTVSQALRIKDDAPFKGIRLSASKLSRTAPFSSGFVRERILSARGFKGLNPDHELIVYVLMETGARPGEIINLGADNIVLSDPYPHIRIRPSKSRGLKTGNAKRDIPLVGMALWATRKAPEGWPELHDREDSVGANINKFMRNHCLKETGDHTLYSFRAAFQDRMLSVRHPDPSLGQMRGGPVFLDHAAAILRWIGFSHQAAIFSMVCVVSYASFGVKMPWLE